jgi:hypothetical protein
VSSVGAAHLSWPVLLTAAPALTQQTHDALRCHYTAVPCCAPAHHLHCHHSLPLLVAAAAAAVLDLLYKLVSDYLIDLAAGAAAAAAVSNQTAVAAAAAGSWTDW